MFRDILDFLNKSPLLIIEAYMLQDVTFSKIKTFYLVLYLHGIMSQLCSLTDSSIVILAVSNTNPEFLNRNSGGFKKYQRLTPTLNRQCNRTSQVAATIPLQFIQK